MGICRPEIKDHVFAHTVPFHPRYDVDILAFGDVGFCGGDQ